MWYACSLTRSHSSGVSGPGFCQIRTGTATRPRSCTSAARRICTRPAASRRQRCAAARGQLRDAGRVADQVGRGKVGEVAHRRQGAVDRLALQGQLRAAARRPASPPRRTLRGRAPGSPRPRPRAGWRPPDRTRRPPARGRPGRRTRRRRACAGTRRRGPPAAIRTGSGISSPLARRRSLAVPALGEVGEQLPDRLGSPSRSVSICATSQNAATWRPRTPSPPSAAARDLDRAHRRRAPRVGSARMIPAICSRSEPNLTGAKSSVAIDRRRSPRRSPHRRCSRRRSTGTRSRSATPFRGRRPRRSPSRIAISVLCRPCSSGTPMPRSVASDSAADHLGGTDPLVARCFVRHPPNGNRRPPVSRGWSERCVGVLASVSTTRLQTPTWDEKHAHGEPARRQQEVARSSRAPPTHRLVSEDGRGYGAAASVTAPSNDASGSASTRTIGSSSAE